MQTTSAHSRFSTSIVAPSGRPEANSLEAAVAMKQLGVQLARRLSRRGDLMASLLAPFQGSDGGAGRLQRGHPARFGRQPSRTHLPSCLPSYLPYYAGLSRARSIQAIRMGCAAKRSVAERIHADAYKAGSTHCAVRQLLDLAGDMAATGGSAADAVQGMTAHAQLRFARAFAALTMHDIRERTTAVRAELSRAMTRLAVPARQHTLLQSCGVSDAAHGQARFQAVRRFATAMAADAGVTDLSAIPSDPLDYSWQVVGTAGRALHEPEACLPSVTLQPAAEGGALAALHEPTWVLSVRPASRLEMICAIFHEMVHSTQHRWIKLLDLRDDALPAHQRDFATLARLPGAGHSHPHVRRWQSQCERDAWACEQMLVIALAGETPFSAVLSPAVSGVPLDARCIDDVHDRVAAQIGSLIDRPLPQSAGSRRWRTLLQALRALGLVLTGPELRLWFDVIATRAGLLQQPSPKHAHALLAALTGR